MWKTLEAGDHIPVSAREISSARIAESLKQRLRLLLHRQVFRVHQRHQPELPPRLLVFGRQPAQLHRPQAQCQGLGIASEGHSAVAPDLPRELIEQQHQRQSPGRLCIPCVELAGDRSSGQGNESLLQQLVKGRVLSEPLVSQSFGELELENLAGLVPLTSHQSSACTLVTLSSRVCSLSVRVLILTVV